MADAPAARVVSACDHDFGYMGLQYWFDDNGPAPAYRYVHTFFCRRCLAKHYDKADHVVTQSAERVALPICAEHAAQVKRSYYG